MFLCSACRVQRMLSFETSFDGITPVFKELSSIIPKISCSVCEMHEKRRFFESKSLFHRETHMFLCSVCRIQRMQSIETCFEGIAPVIKEVIDHIQNIVLVKCTEIDVSSRINHYFSKKHSFACALLVEFNECYRWRAVFKK